MTGPWQMDWSNRWINICTDICAHNMSTPVISKRVLLKILYWTLQRNSCKGWIWCVYALKESIFIAIITRHFQPLCAEYKMNSIMLCEVVQMLWEFNEIWVTARNFRFSLQNTSYIASLKYFESILSIFHIIHSTKTSEYFNNKHCLFLNNKIAFIQRKLSYIKLIFCLTVFLEKYSTFESQFDF